MEIVVAEDRIVCLRPGIEIAEIHLVKSLRADKMCELDIQQSVGLIGQRETRRVKHMNDGEIVHPFALPGKRAPDPDDKGAVIKGEGPVRGVAVAERTGDIACLEVENVDGFCRYGVLIRKVLEVKRRDKLNVRVALELVLTCDEQVDVIGHHRFATGDER